MLSLSLSFYLFCLDYKYAESSIMYFFFESFPLDLPPNFEEREKVLG